MLYEVITQLRMGRLVGCELLVPGRFGGGAGGLGVPSLVDLARDDEGFVLPAQLLAGGGDLLGTQGGAVASFINCSAAGKKSPRSLAWLSAVKLV